MIEYLILEDEQQAIDKIDKVKELYEDTLRLDFPLKFINEDTNDLYYIFVVLEDYREFLTEEDKTDLVGSIPKEVIPINQ